MKKNNGKAKLPAAKDYVSILSKIRDQIEESKTEALAAANLVLNKRNWLIGQLIFENQKQHDWGSSFLDNLAKDLQNMYPDNKGFSEANVYRMAAFYEGYQNIRAAARKIEDLPIFNIPWFHNVVLL